MLVVLPFENLSEGERYDYFSEGLTEEMITELARLSPERLGVIARTSAMQFKSTTKGIAQIGERARRVACPRRFRAPGRRRCAHHGPTHPRQR